MQSAPHGIPVCATFYGHDPATRDYKDASKIKTIDVHPVHPWIATGDEAGNVVVWDYEAETVVLAFAPESVKDAQRGMVEALEAHAAFAAAQGVAVPELAGLGLGLGVGCSADAGATAGSGTEAFISATISGVKPRALAELLPDGVKTAHCGHIRGVRFADEHVLALTCGGGRGDYDDVDVAGNVAACAWDGSAGASSRRSASPSSRGDDGSGGGASGAGRHSSGGAAGGLGTSGGGGGGGGGGGSGGTGGGRGGTGRGGAEGGGQAGSADATSLAATSDGSLPACAFVASVDEALARLSYGLDDKDIAPPPPPTAARPVPHAPPQWLIVMTEHRVLLVEYATRAVVDIPHAALLVEATGPSAMARVAGRGRPGVHSAALLGAGVIAFGCDDGAVRVWHAGYNAVIQVVRATASARPITHMHVISTGAHAAGSTAASLTPGSTGGVGRGTARTVLVTACVDGTVTSWDVVAGRQLVDSGRGVGAAQVKLGADIAEVTVNPATLYALAVTTDRMVSTWDATSRGTPRVFSSRLVTSSAASETGAGSRMLGAVTVGDHPFFPPHAIIAASKGPHLELAVGGVADKGADTGVIFYDLRTARPGLPAKCKVYVMQRHPFRPELIVAGTNIGVFAIQVAPHYGAGALAVSHPTWPLAAPGARDAALPGGATLPDAPAVGALAVYVNAAGMLVAAECVAGLEDAGDSSGGGGGGDGSAVTSPALDATPITPRHRKNASDLSSVPRADSGVLMSPARRGASNGGAGGSGAGAIGGAGSGGGARSSQLPPLAVTMTEHVLLPVLAPPVAPPPTIGTGSAGAPNAFAALAAVLRNPGVLSGTRGVRLRVSGSGAYLAAVWPEHRCYSIFRLRMAAAVLASPRAAAVADAGWAAELVDSGGGLDVAWCSAPVADYGDQLPPKPDSAAAGGAGDGAAAPAAAEAAGGGVIDRFVVVEPGIPVAVKKVYGGGMPIGTTPAAGKGGKGGKDGAGGAAPTPHFPATLALKQLPVVGAEAPTPKIETVLATVPLAQEPVAVWGGPLLAVALASDTGSTSANVYTTFATANLQFYSWAVVTPPQLAEGDAAAAGMTAKAREAANKPRLPGAGHTAATPAPSVAGAINGAGVVWNDAGTAFAVCTPTAVHIAAVVRPSSRAAPPPPSRPGGAHAGGATVVEVARVATPLVCARWLGSSLFGTTGDGRAVAIVPPLVDATSPDAAAASLHRGAVRSVATVVELAAAASGPAVPGAWYAPPLPPPRRGAANPALAVPLTLSGGHLLSMHWVGPRAGAGGGVLDDAGVVLGGVSMLHPGLRALVAAATLPPATTATSDIGQRYIAAASAAAAAAGRLPATTQDALAHYLLAAGNVVAALLLPAASLPTLLAAALRCRPDAFAATPSASRLAMVDVLAAGATLLRLVSDASDADLRFLAAPGLAAPHAPALDATTAVMPLWAQVASYLAVSAALHPATAPAVHAALSRLTRRLAAVGAAADAFLVASLVPTLPPPPPPSDDAAAPHLAHATAAPDAGDTSVDLMLAALRTAAPCVSDAMQAYRAATTTTAAAHA